MYKYKRYVKDQNTFEHYVHAKHQLEFEDFTIVVSYITNRKSKLLHSSGEIRCKNTNAPLELISKLDYEALYQDLAFNIIKNNTADSIDLEKYVKGW